MRKIQKLFILLLLACMLQSLVACSGNNDSSSADPDPPTPGEAQIQMDFVLARAVPSNVTDFRFTGRDLAGELVFGPTTRPKAARITLTVPTTLVNLQIEYLADGTVVGTYGQSVALQDGVTVVINDPNFAPVGGDNSPTASTALERLNQLREIASLPALVENTVLTDGCAKHAIYMVKNNLISHTENPELEAFTAEGAQAGPASNLAVSTALNAPVVPLINLLMTAPFHGPAFIDPRLTQTGIGYYSENRGGNGVIQTGLAINVLTALNGSSSFPVVFPSNGSAVNLRTYDGGESPDPLSGFPGFTAPTGLPIYVLLGTGSVTPEVTAFSVVEVGTGPLTVGLIDETNYVNPDPAQQALGRAILDTRDTIVMIPQDPLVAGKTYNCSLTVNGNTLVWSFSTTSQN